MMETVTLRNGVKMPMEGFGVLKEIGTLDLARPQMLDTRKPSEVRRCYGYLENPVLTSL